MFTVVSLRLVGLHCLDLPLLWDYAERVSRGFRDEVRYYFSVSQQIASDPVANLIAGVLLTQLVLGALSLFGFYHVVKRFMTVEFPAQVSRLDGRLEGVDNRLAALAHELREMRRDVDRHEVLLEQRGNSLDDTRGGAPGRGRRS